MRTQYSNFATDQCLTMKIEQLDKYLYMKQIVIKYTFNVFRL